MLDVRPITAQFIIEIPCFLIKNCINFNQLGDVSINIKFYAEFTTPNIDSVQLTLSEIFVYYYELTPSQDSYMRGLKSIDNRYLKVDHAAYYIDNILANNSFKFKLTQDCVTPFILFHVQTKSDNDSFSNHFQNFLPITAYELLGRNNQSTMNNLINTPFFNNYQLLKHFQDRYLLTNSTSANFGNIYMLNFCINPILALQNNYVGGQAIEDNQYELKLILPTTQTSIAVNVYLFNYQMSHIANIHVVFLDQGVILRSVLSFFTIISIKEYLKIIQKTNLQKNKSKKWKTNMIKIKTFTMTNKNKNITMRMKKILIIIYTMNTIIISLKINYYLLIYLMMFIKQQQKKI